MLTDCETTDDTESVSLPADVTDDSCRFVLTNIVPLSRVTDGRYTTEYDSGYCSAEVQQEILPALKQELDDVCEYLYFEPILIKFGTQQHVRTAMTVT